MKGKMEVSEMEIAKTTPLPDEEFDMVAETTGEDGFTVAGNKRNRQPTGDRKTARTRWDKSDQVSFTSQNRYEILKDFTPSPDDPKIKVIPINVILSKNGHSQPYLLKIVKKLSFAPILYSQPGYIISVRAATISDFKLLQNELASANFETFLFRKPIKVVIRGLHASTSPVDVGSDFKARGFQVTECLHC